MKRRLAVNRVPINGSEEDFFRRLAEMTVAYESQPYLTPLDGKIIAHVRGQRFDFWPRGGGQGGVPAAFA